MADAMALYKLILLYLLDKVSFPMSNGQLTEFMLSKEYTDYFTIQTALADLGDANFVEVKNSTNNSLYTITPQGEETLSFFGHKISPEIQEEIDTYLREHQFKLRNEVSIPAECYPTGHGEYAARCRVLEKGSAIIDLTLVVPTEAQAKSICTNWAAKSQQLYAHLMENLL